MKKLLTMLLLAALADGISAQDWEPVLKLDGEIKTGLIMTMNEDQISPSGEAKREKKGIDTYAGSKDDAGPGGENNSGRFRINADYSIGNFGVKFRLQFESWGDTTDTGGKNAADWKYAFGYGNFWEDQFTLSIGKLGASPWGTGGPELWKEAEDNATLGGMRLEWKPAFIPEEYGKLNAGFVINSFDGGRDKYDSDKPITFLHVLQESVVGVAYTHDYAHARFAVRFDSEADASRGAEEDGNEGVKIVYRIEEHALDQLVLPGLSVWALGYWYGVGAAESNKKEYDVRNWFFLQYAHEYVTAQFRVGYDVFENTQYVRLRPNVYGHLFERKLTFGAMFQWTQDYGDKIYDGSPYYELVIEPLIQYNITPNCYVAAAYNWMKRYVRDSGDYKKRDLEPTINNQWINLRVGIMF